MRVAVCSSQSYDRQYFLEANQDTGHDLVFFDSHLCEETRHMVAGFPAVCVFVNDTLNNTVLQTLAAQKTSLIAIWGAGFNHVDIFGLQHSWGSRCRFSHLFTTFISRT